MTLWKLFLKSLCHNIVNVIFDIFNVNTIHKKLFFGNPEGKR